MRPHIKAHLELIKQYATESQENLIDYYWNYWNEIQQIKNERQHDEIDMYQLPEHERHIAAIEYVLNARGIYPQEQAE